jgi:hypothetical protein
MMIEISLFFFAVNIHSGGPPYPGAAGVIGVFGAKICKYEKFAVSLRQINANK